MKLPPASGISTLLAATLVAGAHSAAAQERHRDSGIDEIVVSATGTQLSLRDAPAAMSVVSRQQLIERPVNNLLDALREEPGITITSAGFTRQSINIRGMDSTHTLFLVDGRRVSASADLIAHSDFELGWIPTEAIERVEVVRGPLSALYGSEALGGVVNVITRPVTDTWSGSLSTRYGEPRGSGGRERQLGLYAAGPIVEDQLGVRLFLDHNDRPETPDPDNPALSLIEGREANSGGATVTWTPDEVHRLDVSYQRAEDDRARRTLTGGPPHAATAYQSRDEVTRQQVDAQYQGDFQDWTLHLGAYRSQLERINKRTEGVTPSAPQEITDDILEARAQLQPWASHDLLVGGEYRRETLEDGTLVDTGRERVRIRSAFLQNTIALTPDQWSLTLGGRLDDHQQFGSQFSPRAYLVWHASDWLTVRGGYGEGFKAPTLKQLSPQFSSFGGGGRFEITGNPELEPETSRSLELGVLGELEGVRWQATVFQNRLRDLVQTQCFENCGIHGQELRTYVNVAEARIRGLETSVSADLPMGFEVGLNYTYLDGRDQESDQHLAERPRHSGNARLGWWHGPWSAQLRLQHVGKQLRDVGQGRETLPDYQLWHITAAWDVTQQTQLRVGVENLTNERLLDLSESFPSEERARFLYLSARFDF